MGARYFGASVPRREDSRLLTGASRFVDDIALDGMLHAAFVRSPHAHARLISIDSAQARGVEGVKAVFTADQLPRHALPLFGAVPPLLAEQVRITMKHAPQYPLARDRVRYVGECVAMVVATTRHAAENAVEAVECEFEPLSAVVDMRSSVIPVNCCGWSPK